ncbi:unnamed protein product [Acanthoscelides obtectus]|uniref:Uncharacterized protein n=1 Tax=Acanthoscelides obtectus TaxID=200917 RepID=A0A9P0MHG5_ACAOB|nr:unnamed protein product [Acanthoscelides obtectus]CAK1651346.1 hypothetical protein AOBTE_LOCUS17207 [Acanthoscelides obtectus]
MILTLFDSHAPICEKKVTRPPSPWFTDALRAMKNYPVTLPNESGVFLNLNSNGQSQKFVFVEHLLQSNDVKRAISPLLQFSLNLSIRKADGNSSNHRMDVPFQRERKNLLTPKGPCTLLVISVITLALHYPELPST